MGQLRFPAVQLRGKMAMGTAIALDSNLVCWYHVMIGIDDSWVCVDNINSCVCCLAALQS